MTEAPDFVQADEPPENLAAQIRELSETLVAKMAALEVKEQEAEALRTEIHKLSAVTIPEKMMEARMDVCGLPELGVTVRMKDWVHATLPRPGEGGDTRARDAAVDWLVAHDAASLIKNEVKVSFDRSEHNMALSAAQELREKFPEKIVELKQDVHHMTYTRWAREQLAAGEILPVDLLGIKIGKVAEVVKRRDK